MKILILLLLLFAAAPALAQTQTASFNLSWTAGPILSDNSNAPQSFIIERSTGTAGPWNQTGTTQYPVVTFIDSIANDTGGVIYCWRIKAHNTAGDSPYSGVACSTSPNVAKPVPTAPQNLKPVPK